MILFCIWSKNLFNFGVDFDFNFGFGLDFVVVSDFVSDFFSVC